MHTKSRPFLKGGFAVPESRKTLPLFKKEEARKHFFLACRS